MFETYLTNYGPSVVGRAMPFEELSPVIDRSLRDEAALAVDFAPLVRIQDVSETELIVRAGVWCDAQQVWDVGQRLSATLRDNLAAAGVEVHSVSVAKKVRKPRKKASPAADDDD